MSDICNCSSEYNFSEKDIESLYNVKLLNRRQMILLNEHFGDVFEMHQKAYDSVLSELNLFGSMATDSEEIRQFRNVEYKHIIEQKYSHLVSQKENKMEFLMRVSDYLDLLIKGVENELNKQ